jgi:hypothetical protein
VVPAGTRLRRGGERNELPEPPVRTAVLQAASGIRIELIERGDSEHTGEYSDPPDMARSQGYYGHWAVDVDDLDAAFAWLIDVGATEVWPPADAVAPGARFGYRTGRSLLKVAEAGRYLATGRDA